MDKNFQKTSIRFFNDLSIYKTIFKANEIIRKSKEKNIEI